MSATTRRPRDWRDRAACRDVDPELFFPLPDGDPGPARAICRGCPVRSICLEEALEAGHDGVRGGLTEEERRGLRRSRGRARRTASSPTGAHDATASDTTSAGSDDSRPAPALAVTTDPQLDKLLGAYPQVVAQVDLEIIRALAAYEGPATASRWETALAAALMLARGVSSTAAARVLGEDVTQVMRWRDRANSGSPLIAVAGGVCSLRRAERVVGPQPPPRIRDGVPAPLGGVA